MLDLILIGAAIAVFCLMSYWSVFHVSGTWSEAERAEDGNEEDLHGSGDAR